MAAPFSTTENKYRIYYSKRNISRSDINGTSAGIPHFPSMCVTNSNRSIIQGQSIGVGGSIRKQVFLPSESSSTAAHSRLRDLNSPLIYNNFKTSQLALVSITFKTGRYLNTERAGNFAENDNSIALDELIHNLNGITFRDYGSHCLTNKQWMMGKCPSCG